MQDNFIPADLLKTTIISGLVHLDNFLISLHFYSYLFPTYSALKSQSKLLQM